VRCVSAELSGPLGEDVCGCSTRVIVTVMVTATLMLRVTTSRRRFFSGCCFAGRFGFRILQVRRVGLVVFRTITPPSR
jgi:hypothetical protein